MDRRGTQQRIVFARQGFAKFRVRLRRLRVFFRDRSLDLIQGTSKSFHKLEKRTLRYCTIG